MTITKTSSPRCQDDPPVLVVFTEILAFLFNGIRSLLLLHESMSPFKKKKKNSLISSLFLVSGAFIIAFKET